jgi:hypothetical protein
MLYLTLSRSAGVLCEDFARILAMVHIVPFACGGADAVWNMQWQTVAAAKAKDRSERRGCR